MWLHIRILEFMEYICIHAYSFFSYRIYLIMFFLWEMNVKSTYILVSWVNNLVEN